MTDRYQVIMWSAGPVFQKTTYHVWDNQLHGEVLGRWDTQEDAQAHADRCNQEQ